MAGPSPKHSECGKQSCFLASAPPDWGPSRKVAWPTGTQHGAKTTQWALDRKTGAAPGPELDYFRDPSGGFEKYLRFFPRPRFSNSRHGKG